MKKSRFFAFSPGFGYNPFFFGLKRVTTGVFAAGFSGLFIYYYTDSRAAIHTYGTCLLLRTIVPPELAHSFAIKAIRWGLAPWDKKIDDSSLMLNVWGKTVSNPVGLAAGVDKQAEAIDGLFDLGFGYVEVGSVTPRPQSGNPSPRFFRLKKDACLINRYGFNSDGHDVIARRLHDRIFKYVFKNYPDLGRIPPFLALSARNIELVNFLNIPKSLRKNKLLAVNLGRNKDSSEIDDYVRGVRRLGHYADVVVVQERDLLPDPKPALCIKISPDLTDLELQDIVDVIAKIPIDGVVVSNTTIQRPENLKEDKFLHEQGGLSGPPLKSLALDIIKFLRGKLPENCLIIGCGGISSGKDAIEYARAGASLIQCCTAFGKVTIIS
ncbi:hypothetical protein MERGE_001993 [Pneumocystis wakefieldiae]|uniref:Dihydroorotate dehydrogenase (quinone), mitochondrial n=1 Tax=Pneumocystis wakefieldiae TaxID=38082 RepID=A0A899FSF1_9ASCO|nr:hypothetical protein MERGE_001993 [Pneumocystis wakefieldiae]